MVDRSKRVKWYTVQLVGYSIWCRNHGNALSYILRSTYMHCAMHALQSQNGNSECCCYNSYSHALLYTAQCRDCSLHGGTIADMLQRGQADCATYAEARSRCAANALGRWDAIVWTIRGFRLLDGTEAPRSVVHTSLNQLFVRLQLSSIQSATDKYMHMYIVQKLTILFAHLTHFTHFTYMNLVRTPLFHFTTVHVIDDYEWILSTYMPHDLKGSRTLLAEGLWRVLVNSSDAHNVDLQ